MPVCMSRPHHASPARSGDPGSRALACRAWWSGWPIRPHAWRRTRVEDWYGRGERRLDIASGTALWHHPGMQVPIRWVLVRDPEGEKEPQAFLCTDLDADPSDILRWFVRRWRIETTFEEARRHLGLETQRQWSDLAILRTTPALFGLFSLVTLWATQLEAARSPTRLCLLVPETRATFSDALALVRSELWTSMAFAAHRITETCRKSQPICSTASYSSPAGHPDVQSQAHSSDQNSLDLIEADLVAAPVIELGGAGRGVVGDHRRLLQRAAVLEVGRDAGGAKGVIADPGANARRSRPPLDHRVGIRLRQRRAGQLPRAPAKDWANVPLKAEFEQKLLPGRWVGTKDTQHAAGDHRGPVFVDAAGGHALMCSLDHHTDAVRLQRRLKRIGDLRRQPLLYLKALGESIDETDQLGDPDHPFIRQIPDCALPLIGAMWCSQ